MADLFPETLLPVSLGRQVECVQREIGYREGVYPRLVATGRMSPRKAEVELRTMRAVLATLEGLAGGERPPPPALAEDLRDAEEGLRW